RTWPGDSSPVAYSTPAVPSDAWLRPAAAWSRSVDLPIPGSPPTRTSEPGTRPPPKTRSSSSIPRRRRGMSASAMPARGSATPAAVAPRAIARSVRVVSRTTVSTSVFQRSHARHCPSQRRKDSPQDWHTKRLWGRAILARPPDWRRGSPRLDRRAWLGEVDVETGLGVLVHDDRGSRLVLAEQQMFGENVFDHVLDHAPQWAGSIGHVVAELDDVLLGRIGDFKVHLLRAQLVAHASEHQVDDLGDLLDREGAEDHRRVDAVEELR